MAILTAIIEIPMTMLLLLVLFFLKCELSLENDDVVDARE